MFAGGSYVLLLLSCESLLTAIAVVMVVPWLQWTFTTLPLVIGTLELAI